MRKRTKKLRKKKVKRGGSSSTYTRSNTYQSREAEREIAMAKVLESQRREAERQLREIDLAKVAELRRKIKGRKRSRGSKTGTYTAGKKK